MSSTYNARLCVPRDAVDSLLPSWYTCFSRCFHREVISDSADLSLLPLHGHIVLPTCHPCFNRSISFFEMAIQPLGKETALLLRASTLVVTPLSLIKELVDNAIDAKATSVKIQMTRDGVNQIEVQDDGVGICPDDFDALGRRAHTSKLRAFQDIPRVGGTSLGFRGEALAAANSVSEVTITTRTAKEKIGHRVCLEPKGGGVRKHDLATAPVGTTVRVQKLFANIPVRKKITTDNIQKSIADVKHLLQAYSLARPQIRLSFGILGDNKAPWSYSPVGTPTVRDAAFQVLGKDLATQYTTVTLDEPASSPNNKLVEELTEHEVSRISVEAFLPKKDADLSKACKKGGFVSVDGRPMAPGRGIMKKVVAAIRARFNTVHHSESPQSGVSNVFIQLDIRCPPGIYDINVSPTKDEVLFTDESRVLEVIDCLLETAYPVTEKAGPPHGSNEGGLEGLSLEDLRLLESIAIGSETSPGPIDLLQVSQDNSRLDLEPVSEKTRQPTYSVEVEEIASSPKNVIVTPNTAWVIDMTNPCEDDDVPQPTAASVIDQLQSAATQRVQKHDKQAEVERNGDEESPPVHAMASEPRQDSTWHPAANASNPWTIAAESAKAKQLYHESGSFTTNSVFDLESGQVNPVFPADRRLARSGTMFPISPSPGIPPARACMCTAPRILLPPTEGAFQSPPSSDGQNPRQMNVLPRFKPPTMSAPRERQPPASRPRARPQQGQQHMEPPNHGAFLPPYDEYQVEDSLPLDSYMVPMDPRALQLSPDPVIPDPFPSPPLLAAANVPAGEVQGVVPSADGMEVNDARALGDGGHITMDTATADETPDQHDPRKYLMRRRRLMSRDRRAGRVLRRMRSALLPLEKTPVEQEMHTVAQSISTSQAGLRSAVLFLVDFDSYVSLGACQPGLADDLEGAADIQARLQSVCGEWAQRTAGVGCDLELNLRGLMKGKSNG